MNDDDIKNLRTRCGYIPSECIQAFEKNLMDSGGVAIGKCLHFGIDLICSGGYMSFFKIIWNYALNHINMGSLRIFMYLKKRMTELDNLIKIYPDETLYNNLDFQTKISEIILILHDAPKFPKMVWPKVGTETHDGTWIKSVSVLNGSSVEIVNRVWKDGDLMVLRTIGNHICFSLSEHSLERALYWMKWGFEEETKVRKENSKACLTTVDRGDGGKSKHEISYYYLQLFVEYYKELARKQQIRMNEEFLAIIELFKNQDVRITATFKKNLLGLCARILCEVPRWKIPAANPLIKDPIVLSRAVAQAPKFFTEILQYPSVTSKNLEKMLKNKGKIEKKTTKKLLSMEEQFAAFDAAMEKYMMK